MKKCLPVSLLVSLLCFGATGCNFSNPSTGGTSNNPSSSINEGIKVESVSIDYDGETNVLGGTTARLTATVKGEGNKKVDWTSSSSVAEVNNGVVKFSKVSEPTDVTITATSKDDATKSASITFTVNYSAIDFANSRGTIDNSCFLDEGEIYVEKGDSALVFEGVYGTKWYVEAEVNPTDIGVPEDQYPKFGFMTGDNAEGFWTGDYRNIFYFVDSQAASSQWGSLGLVTTDDYNQWNWGKIQTAQVSGDNMIKKNAVSKLGLLRDGVHYYLYAGVGDGYGLVAHHINDKFAADEATYAWFGGWVAGYTLSNPVALVGDEVNAKYTDASVINLGTTSTTLYIGDTYQIDYSFDVKNYDPSKLSFTSADPSVATVNELGVVTAGQTDGSTIITVKYGEITKEFAVEVTTDAKFKVVLDGKMDDLIWTDEVKANVLKHNNPEGTVKIDLYASKNSKGIYFYADYQTKENHTAASDWWKGDNIELRLNNMDGLLSNDSEPENNKHQYWVSRYSPGARSNMNGEFVSEPVLNETTGFYEMSFEFFVDYRKAGITADDLVGFTIGANPGGSGWYAGSHFGTGDFSLVNKISDRGITRYVAEESCPVEGHAYESRITKQVTCTTDGEKTYTCKWCGHTYTEVIVAVGEHNYNEAVETVTPSTCSTHGVGHQGCSGCDEYIEVELPFDYHNHSGWNADDKSCSGCGSVLEQGYAPALSETISVDRYNTGGWDNKAWWTILAYDLAGDFTLKVEYAAQVKTHQDPGGWWEGVLPVVEHSIDYKGDKGMGSAWVTRLDWWGWCDPWDSGTKLGSFSADADHRNEGWDAGDGFDNVHKNYTCEWTITRTGTTIRHDFVITAVDGEIAGKTYNYFALINDVDTAKKVNIALVAEFASYQVTAVKAA